MILLSNAPSQILDNANSSPIKILSEINPTKEKIKYNDVFNTDWVKDLKLTLPCNGLNIPKRASRLPNAPRDYRNGIHRGIDFFANWGTEVKAVAKGYIVRADKYYKEYPPDFREQMLLSIPT